MEHRTLGRTGLRVSAVSLGGWLTFGNTVESGATTSIVRRALDLGINHIDSADVYAMGACESDLGAALEGVRRSSYVLATKVFWPTGTGPNDRGLSRKHIRESCDASLKRLRTDYVDLYYCHRFDPEVPLAETVVAMEDLVGAGKALYWGVSCWTSEQIREACRLATRYRPSVNQPPYNVFARHVEDDVLATCAAEGLGVVVWSPLAQGVLTGKYLAGRPPGARGSVEKVGKFIEKYLTPEAAGTVRRLEAIAKETGIPINQLALGWCLRRPEVTSVIVGATSAAQIEENARAGTLPPDVLEAVQKVVREAPRIAAL